MNLGPRRVLLVNANTYTVPYPVFPLGLARVASALREAGHTIHWVDCLADDTPVEAALESFRPDLVGISLRNIDDVAFRKRETFFGSLFDLCARIRERTRVPIVVGGSGFSIFPERLLEKSGADFGIQGEGEASLLALIEALRDGGEIRHIPGLVFRDGDVVRCNPQVPDRLDRSPAPEDRPERLVEHYVRDSRMLNLQTQRGCAHRCCYCTYPLIEGRRHRRRPPESVADEFAQLAASGVPYVFVVDSVFNSSPEHVVETCEAILRRGIRLPWGCFLRPQGLTSELMTLMARAGLAHIEFGTDSLSDAVLEAYDKHLGFEDIKRSAELAAAARVDQCHFLIVGGPGETPSTLEETLERSRLLPDSVFLPIVGMRVYPGTRLRDRALAEGVISADADLLEPVHYFAPGLDREAVQARLAEFGKTDTNWILGEPPPSFASLVERLRRRGVVGPLWTYFARLRRLPSGWTANSLREPAPLPDSRRS
ncbi:MAG: cobalamin-dependent protein [Verrucomicrobiales bacterium]|nr:cobalamin-dependent protein [Verrucomicrobiales bacterium]